MCNFSEKREINLKICSSLKLWSYKISVNSKYLFFSSVFLRLHDGQLLALSHGFCLLKGESCLPLSFNMETSRNYAKEISRSLRKKPLKQLRNVFLCYIRV